MFILMLMKCIMKLMRLLNNENEGEIDGGDDFIDPDYDILEGDDDLIDVLRSTGQLNGNTQTAGNNKPELVGGTSAEANQIEVKAARAKGTGAEADQTDVAGNEHEEATVSQK